MAAVSIKSIFNDFWHIVFIELSAIYSSVHWEAITENVEKMLNCRKPSGGYAEYVCTCCGESRKVPFTCKCRFCTSCGRRYIEERVEKTVSGIFDVPHRHIVFTVPQELRGKIFQNRHLIKVLTDCAAKTALEVIQSGGSGAVPGIIAIVHTFGGDIKFNPHVHMLITEGGLTAGGQWTDIPFLPYALLRRKWQYYLLTALKAELPKTADNARLIDSLFKCRDRGFYVNAEKKMTSARFAARYIGRYMARPALAEYRIIRYNGETVTFWYKDHKSGRKVMMTLEVKEFIKRLIDHIPLKGFKMVRRYGLYARRSHGLSLKILQKCRRFKQTVIEFINGSSVRKVTWRERMIKSFGSDPLLCRKCGEEMMLWNIWHPVYGTIYDLSRDGPFVEIEHKDIIVKEHVNLHVQPALFPG
jgi:Putative transposase/Transposase zinc-binding domain